MKILDKLEHRATGMISVHSGDVEYCLSPIAFEVRSDENHGVFMCKEYRMKTELGTLYRVPLDASGEDKENIIRKMRQNLSQLIFKEVHGGLHKIEMHLMQGDKERALAELINLKIQIE